MLLTTGPANMGKRKSTAGTPPGETQEPAAKPGRKTIAVTVKADLHRMIGIICQHRDMDHYQYLDPILRNRVIADYEAVVREMNAQLDAGKGK